MWRGHSLRLRSGQALSAKASSQENAGAPLIAYVARSGATHSCQAAESARPPAVFWLSGTCSTPTSQTTLQALPSSQSVCVIGAVGQRRDVSLGFSPPLPRSVPQVGFLEPSTRIRTPTPGLPTRRSEPQARQLLRKEASGRSRLLWNRPLRPELRPRTIRVQRRKIAEPLTVVEPVLPAAQAVQTTFDNPDFRARRHPTPPPPHESDPRHVPGGYSCPARAPTRHW